MISRLRTRVLVFNPNSSTSITDTFAPILSQLNLPNTDFVYWTCPTGPSIIKSLAGMFLDAFYADHTVVRLLQSYVGSKPVVGIFDASVHAALHLLRPGSRFGIITTGLPYEVLLTEGVEHLLENMSNKRGNPLQSFGGVAASGIGLGDLCLESREMAREKIMAATTRLSVDVLCVGGVILARIEPWIREGCENELGTEKGREMKIIDQLVAGALLLDALLRHDPSAHFRAALR